MSLLYIVATPIGNLSDISPRALEVLRSADLILAEDTRHTMKLLTHFGIRTKLSSCHKFNEFEKASSIIEKILDGSLTAALVSDAGTPCISDPGCIIVAEAARRGVELIPVPGPSAVTAALSVSGFAFDSFVFVGFLPRENAERQKKCRELEDSFTDTLVIYESPKRILKTLAEMGEHFVDAKFCVCCDLTKKFEKTCRGTCGEVIAKLNEGSPELGEYVIVIQKQMLRDGASTEEKAALSPEAALVEMMLKESLSLREASARLRETGAYGHKALFVAGLQLKEMFLTQQ